MKTAVTKKRECFWIRHPNIALFLCFSYPYAFPGLLVLHWIDEERKE